jgi:predicted permease
MRQTLRSLRSHLGLAVTIIATLTVGLAFTIASIGILNGLLLRPYPYPRLSRLMLVRDAKPREGAHQRQTIAIGDFLDARQAVPAFSALSAWRPQPLVFTSAGAEPERVQGLAVTANFFATLGVTPLFGRLFDTDSDTAGHDGVVVLSRRLWNSRFGGQPSVVGRDISLNGRTVTMIGIIRDEDCYLPGIDAWIPWVFTPTDVTERALQSVGAVGRLVDGSTVSDATGQLASLAQLLAARYPLTNRGRGFELLPLQREQYEFTAPLFLFVLAAAALVLVLAIINVCNLLVARTLDRGRELAVRAMLGANAVEIARVAAGEVLLLTTIATAVALLMGRGVLNAVRVSLPAGIARWFAGWSSLRVDTAALTVGASVGLLVALAITSVVATVGLRMARESGGSARLTRSTGRARRIVIGGEVSLAAALLLGASVMVAGFNRISAAFEVIGPARLLKFTLTLPEGRYPDAARIASFHATLLERVRSLPGVENAALIRNEPASNVPNPIVTVQRDDAPAIQPSERARIDVEVVSPAVFNTLRLDVLAGRALADSDGPDAARVATISQAAASRYWPDRSPVGATVRLGTDPQSVRIVGVVSDFILNWYDPDVRPVIFLPDAQAPARTTSVVVRTRTDPLDLARPIRVAVSQLDDRQPLTELEPLTTTIADSLSPIRIIRRLLLVGAVVASALAAIGIYGMLAHWVSARQRELGVRLALGATRSSVARLVLGEAVLTSSAGIAVGLAIVFVTLRLADQALLGVPALNVGVVVMVAVGSAALTIAGAVGPARRAARVDVAELLREE